MLLWCGFKEVLRGREKNRGVDLGDLFSKTSFFLHKNTVLQVCDDGKAGWLAGCGLVWRAGGGWRAGKVGFVAGLAGWQGWRGWGKGSRKKSMTPRFKPRGMICLPALGFGNLLAFFR